ncbi:MAG: polysaccharide deacetylase family protein [Planctomycetaceae bacterium]
MNRYHLIVIATCLLSVTMNAFGQNAVPDKLVVLTFDDSVKSHFTVVRPILKEYGFGATFFVTEGFEFAEDKQNYMTWQEIAELHRDGFEIGNHTRDHVAITKENYQEQLGAINARCKEFGIAKPVSFAYPGNSFSAEMIPWLQEMGIQFARRGGTPEFSYDLGRGVAVEPGFDHPLLLPSAADARPDWLLEDFLRGVHQAEFGRIAILQFHGVPDRAHDWVSTTEDRFRAYMHYLKVHGYQVVALRDIALYLDDRLLPVNPEEIIHDRKTLLASGRSRDEFRVPANRRELMSWASNMKRHGFTVAESRMVTGLDAATMQRALQRARVPSAPQNKLEVMMYPGGRHPRLGFRDGEYRPRRETKVSVFSPWERDDYLVVDIPEAIWNMTPNGRELLFLAHEDIPTMWDRLETTVPFSEWENVEGGYECRIKLPNGVVIRTTVLPQASSVELEMEIINKSSEVLTGLYTQNCIMLARMKGFNRQSLAHRRSAGFFTACGNEDETKWVIYSWEKVKRDWGNIHCPCIHSDPQFDDLEPGASQTIRGWISFYEGRNVESEMMRLQNSRVLDHPVDHQ